MRVVWNEDNKHFDFGTPIFSTCDTGEASYNPLSFFEKDRDVLDSAAIYTLCHPTSGTDVPWVCSSGGARHVWFPTRSALDDSAGILLGVR